MTKPYQLQGRDRLAFLLSLVPYLMDHGRVSVSDAATHFGLSEAQIRESVRLIAVSGIPGETNSYQHEDLFDIDWTAFEDHDEIVLTHMVALDDSPRFSAREAAALIAGLQYLSSLPEQADRAVVSSLMSKLALGSTGSPSEVAVGSSNVDGSLSIIRDSVAAGRQVEFDYLNSRGERVKRRVDPLRIESLDQDWYLRGWDHGRGAVRTFRLDRMSTLVSTDREISHRADDVTLPDSLFERSDSDLVVTVELEKNALPIIADYLNADVPEASGDGRVQVTLHLAHDHGLKRLVGGLSGVIEVTGPESARQRVVEWAQAALDRYDDVQDA